MAPVAHHAIAARPWEPSATSDESIVVVTVVGRSCLGHADTVLAGRAMALASTAGVELLTVKFSEREGLLIGVDPFADVADPSVFQAICRHLEIV